VTGKLIDEALFER